MKRYDIDIAWGGYDNAMRWFPLSELRLLPGGGEG